MKTKNILLYIVEQNIVDEDKTYSPIWRFRGQPFKLRDERGQNYFLNILKTKKNLLSIIEAKLLVFNVLYQLISTKWKLIT